MHNNSQHSNLCRRVGWSLTGTAVSVLMAPWLATPALAQETANNLVEEVMVTARRRDESLSRVPIAVSAIGAEQLDDRQIESDADLQYAVPGLTIRQTQGNNSLTYSIRGQSADTFSGSPSAVVTYIDEVPLTISGASTFYDLESVQVLKGPQGTLFGRNTTGGAVLYTTAKPTNEQEGSIKVKAGNYDMHEVEFMANVPIVDDKVLLRVAGDSLRKDGYIENVYAGDATLGLPAQSYDLGDIERDSIRVSLTIRPSDQLENTTMLAYSDVGGTNTGASYVYSVYGSDAQGDFIDGPNGIVRANPEYSLFTGSYFFLSDAVTEQKELGLYKTQHPFKAEHEGEDLVFVNTTTYDISDTMRIKNILGYTDAKTTSEQPSLGATFVTFATRNVDENIIGNRNEVESLSEEFQLSGEAFDNKLTYIAGIYLQDQESTTLWPQTYFFGVPGFQSALNSNFLIETETRAIYAQGTYSLTDSLRVTAGARYTQEDVSIKHLSQSTFLAGAPKQDEDFSEPSWELGLEYDINDNWFTYAKVRNSFRSGGFNGSAPAVDASAAEGGNKFEKETVEDFEVGLKFEGTLAERPARMSLAAYHTTIEDVQRIEFPVPPGAAQSIAVTANVPEMEVDGIEFEFSIVPTDIFEVGLLAAYTDAEFTDKEVTIFGTDYEYSPVANTPELSWTLWTNVDIITDPAAGMVSLRAEYYSQDDMYFSNTADSLTPATELPSYELVNARLSWKNIMNSQFSGALFGKNLTDEEYFVGGMPLGASLGHNAAVVGEPRTYGVEVSYQF